ncbi:SRPBCC family protein [Nonomuraea mesophila]|uniref:SRPBCC family protein n=1 Tax=Nonomuraea mesophila TaxID=2530382 RepID=A0A4R5FPK4_9ACTN|nr:SRPBCC family protein [Nonomuraea mesophila]TDE54607.1 SRPBCC family protein [Nonomuraea mesophila]
MAVLNIHQRALPASLDEVGRLIDTLAGPTDLLWPHSTWPAMRFDRPLGTGAVGGHGPVRYVVSHYVPGRWIRFAFTGPRGFDGFHEYAVSAEHDHTVLGHTLAMSTHGPARLTWPLIFRPLHDALIEDSFDRAEHAVTGAVARPARWSGTVRRLRLRLAPPT